ncbi:putative SPX domain-containing protein [Helianthus annuus]|nr:putative SPX domain-containing protein [Helianthus annuus]
MPIHFSLDIFLSLNQYLIILYFPNTDEESNRGVTDQILPDEETITEDMEKNDMQSIVSPRSEETEEKISKMEGQSLSGSISNCHGNNLKIRIPLTNPTRAFSYLLWEDLINQSSKKHNSQGKKLHINKTKLHHAEKMIRGALVELYKGLGYLKTYR